jgi:hypothetical protein
MLWMIYVILHRLYLVNEQNAMINMKKDMVKKSRNQTIKKNSIDFDLEKVGSSHESLLQHKKIPLESSAKVSARSNDLIWSYAK